MTTAVQLKCAFPDGGSEFRAINTGVEIPYAEWANCDTRPKWVQPVFAALVPLSAYLAVHCHEWGFCMRFGVTPELIRPDVPASLLAGLSLISFIAFCALLVALSHMRLFRRRNTPTLYGYCLDTCVLIAISTLLTFGPAVSFSHRILTGVFLLLPLGFWGAKVIRARKVRSGVSSRTWHEQIGFCSVVILILCIFSLRFGYVRAGGNHLWLMVSAPQQPMLVIRSYGNELICAKFEPSSKKVYRTFYLLKRGEGLTYPLVTINPGPLQFVEN